MAWSRKGKRRITVDEQAYLWTVSAKERIRLTVMPDADEGQVMVAVFERHDDRVPNPDGTESLVNPFVVTTYIVRQAILHARAEGWEPLEGRGTFAAGALDRKIDLRLHRNRVNAIKARAGIGSQSLNCGRCGATFRVPDVTAQLACDVRTHLAASRRIAAVAALRGHTGMDVATAKFVMDHLAATPGVCNVCGSDVAPGEASECDTCRTLHLCP